MKRFINHPPKPRPFEDPKPTTKVRISALSLEKDVYTPGKEKNNEIHQNLLGIFILISSILTLALYIFSNINIGKLNNFKNKFFLLNSTKNKETNSSTNIKYLEINKNSPFSIFLESKLHEFLPNEKLLTNANILITSLYYSLLVLTILRPTNTKPHLAFLYFLLFSFTDSFIKRSTSINYGNSLIVSIELLLSILLLFSISYLHPLSESKTHFAYWWLCLCFSLFLELICISIRIEYFSLLIPIIITVINKIRYDFIIISAFVFIFILNCIFLVLIDRFIGLPQITFDSISISTFAHALIETDYNGLLLFLLFVIIFSIFEFIRLLLFSKSGDNKKNTKKSEDDKNLPQKDIIFILLILLGSLSLLKINISSIDNPYISRVYIIRLILFVITGKIICMYNDSIKSLILLIIAGCIVVFYRCKHQY